MFANMTDLEKRWWIREYEQAIVELQIRQQQMEKKLSELREQVGGMSQGRTLTAEEIAAIQLTPPDEIRDCRAKGPIHWR